MRIAIILGSTRPGRNGEAVAKWVLAEAQKRKDAEFDLVDVADFHLPLLDEPIPPSMGKPTKPHTLAWAKAIARYDGFVLVTAEYNRSIPAALKNAIDYLYAEWNNKAAGFVSYGSMGGSRAVEHLRGVMGEIQIADVRAAVQMSLFDDWVNFTTFQPRPMHLKTLTTMLDQLVSWVGAMRTVRTG